MKSYHFLERKRGGGFLGIKKSALIGCMSHRAGTQSNIKLRTPITVLVSHFQNNLTDSQNGFL